VVDKAKWGGVFWKGGVGYLTKDMVAAHMPAPAANNLVMVCGPPGMMKAVCGDKVSPSDQGEVTGLLKELGYSKDMVYKF
jgi:cytochrome-b5 reductase